MSEQLSSDPQLLLEWFEKEYDCGIPYPRNFDRSLSYLQGLMDASDPDDARFQGLVEVISTLRRCQTLIEVIQCYKVKKP